MRGIRARAIAASVASLTTFALAPARAQQPDPACIAPRLDDRCESWVARYDNGALDIQTSIAVDPQGSRIFVTGYSIGDQDPRRDTSFDIATVAFETETGHTLWVARHDGPAGLADIGREVSVSPDGSRVYVSGTQDMQQLGDSASGDFVTLAYDAATGATLWSSVYAGPGGRRDEVASNAVGPGPSEDGEWLYDGDRVYVTGRSNDPQKGYEYAVVALEGETGAMLWEARYDPGGVSDEPVDVAVSADGARVFVLGDTWDAGGQPDYVTAAFDTGIHDTEEDRRGGERLWVARYDGPASGWDDPTAMGVSPDGETVYVTGQSDAGASSQLIHCGHCDFTTIAYDAATGEERWVARYPGPEGAESLDPLGFATALAVDPLGRYVFVGGESLGPGLYTIVAHDAATGALAWSARSQWELPYDLAVSGDGAVVFATGAAPYLTAWQSTYGQTWVPGDAVTVAYAAGTGEQLWAARHNSSELGTDSWARSKYVRWTSLAVSPSDDRMFVARTFARTPEFLRNEVNSHDYGVMAYEVAE